MAVDKSNGCILNKFSVKLMENVRHITNRASEMYCRLRGQLNFIGDENK